MARIIHTADWQLGMTRHFFDPEDQARYTDARIAVIHRIGQVARDDRADAVVVAGDVFESGFVGPQTVMRSLEAMAAVPCPVVLLPGNHDPYDAASVFRSALFREHAPRNVHVLADATPLAIGADLEIVGAPWANKRPLKDLVAAACRGLAPTGKTRVLVGHGIVDALNPDATNPAALSVADAERALAEGRIHYLALGDRHSVTAVGRSGRIWYAGTPEVTDFDEVRPGYVLSVELGDEAVAVHERRVGTWTFRKVAAELVDDEDLARFEAALRGLADKPQTVVKLLLRGAITIKQQARLHALLDGLRPLFGALMVWERHSDLVLRPDDLDFGDMALSGFAKDALDRLVGSAASDDTARDALALLYRLSAPARPDQAR